MKKLLAAAVITVMMFALCLSASATVNIDRLSINKNTLGEMAGNDIVDDTLTIAKGDKVYILGWAFNAESNLKEVVYTLDGVTKKCEDNKEFPWTYYYIKYDAFRTGRYGKYWWDDFDSSPYDFTTLHQRQKISENSYNPFLKAVNENVSREHWGRRFYFNNDKYILETQRSYQIISIQEEGEEIVEEINIDQNEKGIDTENRIEKMKNKFNN